MIRFSRARLPFSVKATWLLLSSTRSPYVATDTPTVPSPWFSESVCGGGPFVDRRKDSKDRMERMDLRDGPSYAVHGEGGDLGRRGRTIQARGTGCWLCRDRWEVQAGSVETWTNDGRDGKRSSIEVARSVPSTRSNREQDCAVQPIHGQEYVASPRACASSYGANTFSLTFRVPYHHVPFRDPPCRSREIPPDPILY